MTLTLERALFRTSKAACIRLPVGLCLFMKKRTYPQRTRIGPRLPPFVDQSVCARSLQRDARIVHSIVTDSFNNDMGFANIEQHGLALLTRSRLI